MLSSAKMDAFIHASRGGCEPGIPLVQSEAVDLVKPPGILTVACPAGCGVTLSIPLEIVDIPSASCEHGELDIRFVARAPELHDCFDEHSRTCPVSRGRSTALRTAAG